MRIYVHAVLPILGGSLFRLVVEPSHTINMLRDDIDKLTGINPNRQCLRTIRGHIECGGNLLSEFNQTPQAELERTSVPPQMPPQMAAVGSIQPAAPDSNRQTAVSDILT